MFGAEEIGVEIAEIAFLSETQYVKNFLNPVDVDGSSEGTHSSCLEEALQSEFTRVREDYASATSESYTAIGHVSKVENHLLRFSCCCCRRCCSQSAYWLPTRKNYFIR